jgi:hypothetical protein
VYRYQFPEICKRVKLFTFSQTGNWGWPYKSDPGINLQLGDSFSQLTDISQSNDNYQLFGIRSAHIL